MRSVLAGMTGGLFVLVVLVSGLLDRWMPWSNIESPGEVLYLDLAALAQAYPSNISEDEAIRYMQEVQRILIDLTAEGFIVVDAGVIIYGKESREIDPTALMRMAEHRLKKRSETPHE